MPLPKSVALPAMATASSAARITALMFLAVTTCRVRTIFAEWLPARMGCYLSERLVARGRRPDPTNCRMAEPIDVSAGLIVRNGLVLACKRRPDQTHANRWEFPGGKQEPGETAAACLRRELQEELGIDADVGEEVWRTEHRYGSAEPVRLIFLKVPAFRGTLDNRVFAEIRWVELADLAQLDFLEADRELIERLANGHIAL